MRIRVDFGRVVPGVILLLAGLALLALLLVVSIISFLFSFIPAWSGVLQAALELMLVSVVLMAAGVITVLTGVSWWGRGERVGSRVSRGVALGRTDSGCRAG